MTGIEIIRRYLTEEEETNWYRNMDGDHTQQALEKEYFNESYMVVSGHFGWIYTPEGADYWGNIHDRISDGIEIFKTDEKFTITKHKFIV